MTMSADLEHNDYATFCQNCVISHILITLCFISIFWSLYYCNNGKESNTISTLHSIIVFIGAIIAFFYDELYEIENMVTSKKWIVGICLDNMEQLYDFQHIHT